MNPKKLLRLLTLCFGVLTLNWLEAQPQPAADGTTALSGRVSNTGTGQPLKGANVVVSPGGRSVLTDDAGYYIFRDLAPGDYDVEVSYIGLDTNHERVSVQPARRAVLDVGLTTQIYTLGKFTVTSEREGNAAALTEQRYAPNLKAVATIDSYGTLPNLSFGELAIRLPGVAPGTAFAEGVVTGISVRGTSPQLNSVTIDGAGVATNSLTRAFEAHTINAAMFEQVEVVKGQTPDKSADSIGGGINMKSRNPLAMKEKRRITYATNLRWAPPFTDQIPLRSGHRMNGMYEVGYQEVFDAFKGDRNLGVYLHLFRNEYGIGTNTTVMDYENTGPGRAYVWDYNTEDATNKRIQNSLNLKSEYKLSEHTRIWVNYINNFNLEPERQHARFRAYTSQTVGTTGNAAILPDYTNKITRVRATPSSIVESRSLNQSYHLYLRHYALGVVHDFGRWKFDYDAVYSRGKAFGLSGSAGSGIFTMQVANVGWMLDFTNDPVYPRFVQTEGPDIRDPRNYRPAPQGMYIRNQQAFQIVKEVHENTSYRWNQDTNGVLQAGVSAAEQRRNRNLFDRRWNYIGTGPLPSDPTLVSGHSYGIPFWNSRAFVNRFQGIVDPTLWREDTYSNVMGTYTNTTALTESTMAAYVMAKGNFGTTGFWKRTGYLTGVRYETTDTEVKGFVRSRTLSTAAERLANPLAAATRDYGNPRTMTGSYSDLYPSVHLNHDFNKNVKTRLSWSTGFGRPPPTSLYPSETPNETAQTVTISNPALKPQKASNWDATVDYYFEPVGNLSVGWFHKTITDYIVSDIDAGIVGSGASNGFEGQYSGFRKLTSMNAGKAFMQGWEISYQQQLSFLPGLLKTLNLVANYTQVTTHGQFGAANLSSGQVAGFIPKTGNVSLSWKYRDFGARVVYNITGEYLETYAANAPQRNSYQKAREIWHLNFDYKLSQRVGLSLNVENITNSPRDYYRGYPERLRQRDLAFVAVTAGLKGQF